MSGDSFTEIGVISVEITDLFTQQLTAYNRTAEQLGLKDFLTWGEEDLKNCTQDVVRLAQGSAVDNGRVEIFHEDSFGTVCDDGNGRNTVTGIQTANVVCRQLSFASGYPILLPTPGTGTIWLDELRCTGSEASLAACRHPTWGSNDCSHSEDFSVQCIDNFKLVDGDSDHGRVLVKHEGVWKNVCDDSFDSDNNGATVVCKSLGFASGRTASSGEFPATSADFWLDGVVCDGSEASLGECAHNRWGENDCGASEAAGVYCSTTAEPDAVFLVTGLEPQTDKRIVAAAITGSIALVAVWATTRARLKKSDKQVPLLG